MANELSSSVLISTAVIVGIISVAIYVFVIRPTLPATRREPAVVNQNVAASSARANAAATPQKEQIKCSRVPPHVSEASSQIAINGGSNLLIDGLVAFKHIQAAVPPLSSSLLPDDEIRRARAKLFSNLLEGSGVSAPPAKGSAIVVTVPVESVACEHQRKVLFLLATYYNLLVILSVTASEDEPLTFTDQDRMDAIATLRGSDTEIGLPCETLPTHRIVVSSTVTGRVAFVRQLQRIELVLDFDPEVLALLTRFGHRVIVYDNNSSDMSVSKLGQAML